MYEGQERCMQDFGGETCEKETILEYLGIYRRMVLKCMFEELNEINLY